MKNDNFLTLLDAMMLSKEGKNPSDAILNQETRGQADVVRNQRLPIRTNEMSLPSDIYLKGISTDASFDERRAAVDKNIIRWTKLQYKKMGIKIVGEHDDLFYDAVLPEGWQIKATDHSMWNDLIDNNGKKRAQFFYKAAFYDRSAFINFSTRFRTIVDHVAPPDTDYHTWSKSDFEGKVFDGDTVIYWTSSFPPPEDYLEQDKLKEYISGELKNYMRMNYPDYKNINAYWDL